MKRLLVSLLFLGAFNTIAGEGKNLFNELNIRPVPLSLSTKISMVAAPLVTYAGCYGLLKQACHTSIGLSATTSFFAATVAGFMGYTAYKYSDYGRLADIKNLLSPINSDHLKTITLIAKDSSIFTRTEMDSLSSELLQKELLVTNSETIIRSISVLENYQNKIRQAEELARNRKELLPFIYSSLTKKNTIPLELSSYLSVIQTHIKTVIVKSNQVLNNQLETSIDKEESNTLESISSISSFSNEVPFNENPENLQLHLNSFFKTFNIEPSNEKLKPFNILKSLCGKPCLEKAGYTVNSRISRSSSSGYESPNSMPLTKKNLDQHNRINGDVFTSESEASNQGFDGTHSECESFHTCPGFEIEQ